MNLISQHKIYIFIKLIIGNADVIFFLPRAYWLKSFIEEDQKVYDLFKNIWNASAKQMSLSLKHYFLWKH